MLGYVEDPRTPTDPTTPNRCSSIPSASIPGCSTSPPEPKANKNRMHLDLDPDLLRDTEVERLTALGASLRRPSFASAT